jgi:Rrf2 family nitric oxide-sensitive transcriptional repressor
LFTSLKRYNKYLFDPVKAPAMQLTLHTDYALRLLIYLGVHEGHTVTVQSAAESYGISANHLAKVTRRLTQLGYVRTARGRGGGLQLRVPPASINIGQLVRQTETSRALVECFQPHWGCPIEPACGLKPMLRRAQDAFFAELDRHTLADLLHQPHRLATLLVRGKPAPQRRRADPAPALLGSR